MKTKTHILLAAIALVPGLALAGDISGSNTVTGFLSSANGNQNTVPGPASFATGQLSFVPGAVAFVAGQQNFVQGNWNTVFGYNNTAGPAGSFNIIGGTGNVATASRTLLIGNNLSDNGRNGSVILSDSNPFGIRTNVLRLQSPANDSFTSAFNGGYFMRTSHGQGSSPNAGLFVSASGTQSSTVSRPAFVGINTSNPTQALDVVSNAEALIVLTGSASTGMRAVAGGQTWFVGNEGAGGDFKCINVNTGLSFIDIDDSDPIPFVGLCGQINPSFPVHVGSDATNGNGAHCTAGGVWTDASSRTFKENFTPVDAAAVLKKVTELPVRTWNYKGVPEVVHMGPVAEDFRDMFGLGENEKYLASLDTNGVALAAIQGLNEVVKEKDKKIQDLEERLTKLEKLLQSGK